MHKHGKIAWFVLALLALAALACGLPGPSDAPTPPPTAEPEPMAEPTPIPPAQPAKPAENPPPAAGSTSIEIINNSPYVICYVYISPTSSDTWGPDQLGEGEVIEIGQSRLFSGLAPDFYDFQTQDCAGTMISLNTQVDMTAAGSYTLDVTGAEPGSVPPEQGGVLVTVINNSSVEVCYVYVSPTTADSWGSDQLGETQTIPVGTFVTIGGYAPGRYDLRAEGCDQNTYWEAFDQDLTSDFEWTLND
ncbi:MAG: hypothetical protein Kow00124_25640 [Anaerolineae bacterium]